MQPKKDLTVLIATSVLAIIAVFCAILSIVVVVNDSGKNEVVAFNNPVIKNADETWTEYFESTRLFVGETRSVGITLKGGKVAMCVVQGLVEVPTEDSKGTMVVGSEIECDMEGLTGDVYKVVEFGRGNSPEEFNIGFIMTDGSVYYVKTKEAITNNDFTVKGPVNVGGYVVDVIKLDVLPTDDNPAGGLSSVFVMRDGSLVEFENSMLE